MKRFLAGMLVICFICSVFVWCNGQKQKWSNVQCETGLHAAAKKVTCYQNTGQSYHRPSKLEQTVEKEGMSVVNERSEAQEFAQESPEQNQMIEETTPMEYTFKVGTYIVGQDLVSGTYDVNWVSGRGTCFAGKMKETFGNSEYTIKEYRNLELKENDAVVIFGTLVVKFTLLE